jgi:hypothetical protein
MIAHIDGYYVAAQIRLIRQTHRGSILLLEGEKDDRVFRRLTDESCDIEVGFGRAQVIEALDLLEEDGFGGVVAVIDADFDRIIGASYNLENLCLTDCHDLDITIFMSPALDRFIAEYADPNLFNSVMKGDVDDLRSRLLNAAIELSCCRLASHRHSLRIYFKDVRLFEFISSTELTIDMEQLVMALIGRSNTTASVQDLKAYINVEKKNKHDLCQLVNGHDIATILGVALQKMIASRRIAQTWGSEIESGLRLAFDWESFTKTELFNCLRSWEDNNKTYRVLRRAWS